MGNLIHNEADLKARRCIRYLHCQSKVCAHTDLGKRDRLSSQANL